MVVVCINSGSTVVLFGTIESEKTALRRNPYQKQGVSCIKIREFLIKDIYKQLQSISNDAIR